MKNPLRAATAPKFPPPTLRSHSTVSTDPNTEFSSLKSSPLLLYSSTIGIGIIVGKFFEGISNQIFFFILTWNA